MLVDKILEYYGHNPAYYQTNIDKQVEIINELLNTAYPILTVLLAILPWIFYLLQRKKHQKNHKQFVWTIIKFSVAGLALGLFLPILVIWITGAIAVRTIYG